MHFFRGQSCRVTHSGEPLEHLAVACLAQGRFGRDGRPTRSNICHPLTARIHPQLPGIEPANFPLLIGLSTLSSSATPKIFFTRYKILYNIASLLEDVPIYLFLKGWANIWILGKIPPIHQNGYTVYLKWNHNCSPLGISNFGVRTPEKKLWLATWKDSKSKMKTSRQRLLDLKATVKAMQPH